MKADRLLSILLLLQTRGKMTTQRLADELEVSRRTILRDLDALSVAGVPVYTEGGPGGGVSLDDKYRISLTGLREDEVRSLFVESLPGPLSDLGLEKGGKQTLLKLAAALPSSHQAEVERNRQRVLLDPTGWWPNATPTPFLTLLQTALYSDQKIAARYERADGTVVERILAPYSLVAKAGVWYLVAQREGEFKTYRVSRFQRVDLLPEQFSRCADFDLTTYWQKQNREFAAQVEHYYSLLLGLTLDGLRFVRWYLSDAYPIQILEQANNTYTVRIELGSLEQAKMLVLGLGRQATILEPSELREAVLQAVSELLNYYNE